MYVFLYVLLISPEDANILWCGQNAEGNHFSFCNTIQVYCFKVLNNIQKIHDMKSSFNNCILLPMIFFVAPLVLHNIRNISRK